MCFSVQVQRDLTKLSQEFKAEIDKESFLAFDKLCQLDPQHFKGPDEEDRVYPHTFLPVMVWDGKKRLIKPMRYRLRPHDAVEEVPSKYNLFNARLDALEKRKSWRPLFGRKHGVIGIRRFYEWVEGSEGKKQLVAFKAKEEMMSVPVLFDYFQSPDLSFYSCALITKEPPPEVEAAGHDRCPIFIRPDLIDQWLRPESHNKADLYSLLEKPHETYYSVEALEKSSNPKKRASDQLDLFGNNGEE